MRRNSLYNFPSVKNNKYYNAMIVDENNKLVIGTILNEKHVKDLRKGFKNNNVEKKHGYYLKIKVEENKKEGLSISELTNKHAKLLVINLKAFEKYYVPVNLLVNDVQTIINDFKSDKEILKVNVKDRNHITISREKVKSIEIIEVYK